MSEVIDCLKVLKLHGMAQAYAQLREYGGTAAPQAVHWLVDGTIAHPMHSSCYAARCIGIWPAPLSPGSAVHEARVLQRATLAFIETNACWRPPPEAPRTVSVFQ